MTSYAERLARLEANMQRAYELGLRRGPTHWLSIDEFLGKALRPLELGALHIELTDRQLAFLDEYQPELGPRGRRRPA